MTDEEWDAVVAVNLRGTFVCSRAALRHMIPQRSGRIINTASGLGLRASPGGAVYGATKAAIINFTRSLAAEVSRYGITANAIGPGVTDTPFWRAFRSDEDIAAALESGQVGQPEDFVPLVVFLCSEAGRTHSGQMFDRDIYMPRE
jgi:NAD(P)-dependent dehydrogenase (short-subunit alcohol dehydrogenase family)